MIGKDKGKGKKRNGRSDRDTDEGQKKRMM